MTKGMFSSSTVGRMDFILNRAAAIICSLKAISLAPNTQYLIRDESWV